MQRQQQQQSFLQHRREQSVRTITSNNLPRRLYAVGVLTRSDAFVQPPQSMEMDAAPRQLMFGQPQQPQQPQPQQQQQHQQQPQQQGFALAPPAGPFGGASDGAVYRTVQQPQHQQMQPQPQPSQPQPQQSSRGAQDDFHTALLKLRKDLALVRCLCGFCCSNASEYMCSSRRLRAELGLASVPRDEQRRPGCHRQEPGTALTFSCIACQR